LYTRCEDYRKQVLAVTDKLQQEKFERKQMKAELENACKEHIDALKASRKCPVCKANSHLGGSVAECLACWTQAQKSPGSNRSRDAVG